MIDNGWLAPIHANSHDDFKNVVFSGNQRLRAAQELASAGHKDFEKAPVVYVEIADEKTMYEQSLILNSHEGEWDMDMLSIDSAALEIEPVEVEFLAGMNIDSLPHFGSDDFKPQDESGTFDDIAERQLAKKKITCPHCGEVIDMDKIDG